MVRRFLEYCRVLQRRDFPVNLVENFGSVLGHVEN